MVKKKNSLGRRRKKLNTTTNKGAKRSKTEDNKNPAEYRDGILQGIRALLGKLDDKTLLAVMMHVGSLMEGEEKQKTES